MNIEFLIPSIPYTPPSTLRECTTLTELSIFLGFDSYKALSAFIYPNVDGHYRQFSIHKRNGSERVINAPNKSLKKVQKIIFRELTRIYKPRKSAHGFIPDRSIVTNAQSHVGKKFVLNVDIENFFGVINFGRVKCLFKSHPILFSDSMATVLAQLCCLNNSLPQGAPSSPIISNMICYKLDSQLQQIASRNRCTYTRYADDITFSFTQSRNKLPRDLVILDKEGNLHLGNVFIATMESNGFLLNPKKTRISSTKRRQEVTGLTVNDVVNIKRDYIRQTNSLLHSWGKFGVELAEAQYLKLNTGKSISRYHRKMIDSFPGKYFRQVVSGRINYVKMVKGAENEVYKKLAYKFSCRIGHPNKDILKTPLDVLSDSVFVIEECISESQGTGFLVDSIGFVTNAHVVERIDDSNVDCMDVFRCEETDKPRKVNFLKSNLAKDLAIFKPTKDFNGIKRLRIAEERSILISQIVTVIGFPQYNKGERPYINTGKVVQKKTLFGVDMWLVDIPIIHGISGGPVFNEKLEVIGIATAGSGQHDNSTKFHGFIPIGALLDYYHST